LELLTIITRTLQIFSSFVLIVIFFSFVTIKVKTRKNKKGMSNFSNQQEGEMIMSDIISENIKNKSDVFLNSNNLDIMSSESKNSVFKKKIKIYTVYNPHSNPNFYLHNKLNWYKNFD
jgi:hypothetical protein